MFTWPTKVALLLTFAANTFTDLAPSVKLCDDIVSLLPNNCNCSNVASATSYMKLYGIKVTCPQLEFERYPNNVTVKCNENLKQLPEPFQLNFRSVTYLTLDDCASTGSSFREITNLFGISHVYAFRIHGSVSTLNKTLFCNLTNVFMIELNSVGLENIREDPFECLQSDKNDNGQAIINLEIINNNITELSVDTFRSLKQLSTLSLKRNNLMSLPDTLFYHNYALESLDLSFNKLSNLPMGVFTNLTKLTQLDLQGNNLVEIQRNLLAPLKKLEVLDLGSNRIKQLSYGDYLELENLVHLDLRDNQLTSLDGADPRVFALRRSVDLSYLQLSGNRLSQIYESWTWMTTLEKLNLSRNQFTHLQIKDFGFRSDIVVDLSHNLITDVNISASAATYAKQSKRCRILLHDNPLSCNCKLRPFAERLEKSTKLRVAHLTISPLISRTTTVNFEDAPSLKCSSPNALMGAPLGRVLELTCDISDEHYICPSECSCLYRRSDRANAIDCTNAGLTEMPLFFIYDQANQTTLNLQGNHLKQLSLFEDSSSAGFFSNITALNLSNTDLSGFFASHHYKNIKVLDLSHNQMSTLSGEVLSLIATMDRVMLHHNPWRCDCENQRLIAMVTNGMKVGKIEEVKCANGTTFTELRLTELCSPSYVIVVYLLVGALLLAMVVVYYGSKVKALLYCNKKRSHVVRTLVTQPDNTDKNKVYDAFISFAEKDMGFVSEVLVPRLDGRYKLCLHYRDWSPDEPIPKQIITSIQRSRRTIVVLSPAYLRTLGSLSEFSVAHAEATRERVSRLIIIMYQDVTGERCIYSEISAYLEMNAYRKWEDTPAFWNHIFNVMPPPTKNKELPPKLHIAHDLNSFALTQSYENHNTDSQTSIDEHNV